MCFGAQGFLQTVNQLFGYSSGLGMGPQFSWERFSQSYFYLNAQACPSSRSIGITSPTSGARKYLIFFKTPFVHGNLIMLVLGLQRHVRDYGGGRLSLESYILMVRVG
jgi:hypothetical protein